MHDLVIVGAGPSGLATAIAASQAGLDYAILEKGVLVNSIYGFPTHMVFFTTPELLEIGGVPLVTPYEKPTRIEALRYYRRVADKFDVGIEFGGEGTKLRIGADYRRIFSEGESATQWRATAGIVFGVGR